MIKLFQICERYVVHVQYFPVCSNHPSVVLPCLFVNGFNYGNYYYCRFDVLHRIITEAYTFQGDLQGTELVLLILFFNSNAIEIFIYCYLANNITHTVRWVPCLQSENKIIKRCRYFRLFCSMIQFQHTYTAAILPNSIQKPFRQCCF